MVEEISVRLVRIDKNINEIDKYILRLPTTNTIVADFQSLPMANPVLHGQEAQKMHWISSQRTSQRGRGQTNLEHSGRPSRHLPNQADPLDFAQCKLRRLPTCLHGSRPLGILAAMAGFLSCVLLVLIEMKTLESIGSTPHVKGVGSV